MDLTTMQLSALAAEEAILERRLRRLEADVQMIAASASAHCPVDQPTSQPTSAAAKQDKPVTLASADNLGSLVADVADAAAEFARAAAEEQEPVLAAVTLRGAARCGRFGAAVHQACAPLERWWRQLLAARRIANACERYDGSYDGCSLRFSTRHKGAATQLSLSVSTRPGKESTGYSLSCDLGGLLPVQDLERAANRLLLEPGGGGFVEFVTAHVWPAMERACFVQADRDRTRPGAAVDEAVVLHMVTDAQTEASLALARAKALLRQNHGGGFTSHSSSHPSLVVLENFEHSIQDQRRPVPPSASGRHGAGRQRRPTYPQVDTAVTRNVEDRERPGDADNIVSTTPLTPSKAPTPGTPPPRPANCRPKRPPSVAAAPLPRVTHAATRAPPGRQPPLLVPGVVPLQAVDDSRRAKLLSSLASIRSPGSLSDCFKVGSVVGTGQSTVRHAICIETGKQYAVKYIRKDLDGPGEVPMLQELVTECTLMSRLHGQPNILQLAGVFESQSCYEIVTEYCSGGDLFSILIDRLQASDASQVEGMGSSTPAPVFTEAEAAAIMRQVIQGVAACHAKGIAHRDIKPENLLLRQPLIVLADFGLAADVSSGPIFQSCGTAEFVAPEVLHASCGGYNQSCDIWSLGVLLYILMCGYPPYQSMAELLQLREDAPLRFPHDEWATVSVRAIELIRSMLDRRPENRPKAAELLEHPWLCGSIDGMSHAVLAPCTLTNLRRWNAKRKMRSCVMALIAGRRLKGLVAGLAVEALIVELAVEQSGLPDVPLCSMIALFLPVVLYAFGTETYSSEQAIALCHCFKAAVCNRHSAIQHTEVDRSTFVDVVSRAWQNGRAVSPSLAAEQFDAYFSLHSLKFALGRQHRQGNQHSDQRQGTEEARTINWKGFCLALASLLPGVEKESKLKFAFNLFDEDGSGSIDEVEFASMIRCLLVGKCIETESLNLILQAEFEVADASKDGTIEWQEFVAACDHCPTILRYFKSLERLSVHTQRRMQETAAKTTLTRPALAGACHGGYPSANSTVKPMMQAKDDGNVDDDSEGFNDVQDEETAILAGAIEVAFDAAVLASNDQVDKAWQGMEEAAETVWDL